jgi:elongation factor 3
MSNVGFASDDEIVGGKAARIMDPVSSLSGGWRMKLALARAMLQKADILLMDDPTNHLDVKNVAWVENYIQSLKDVTCLIVSSNSGLLGSCCQQIVHFDNLRLHTFRGSIGAFVKAFPAAKSYFELKSSSGLEFRFPDPGFIEGVNSRGKALMKMDNVDFTYPGNPRPTVVGLTVRVSQASRVACLGPNGAGKSTMIKLLTGELTPATGAVWKHPNCKLAYVAQHAFHHIEEHLKMTPTEYIMWRYEFGQDKESLEKVTMVLTEKEEAALLEVRTWEYTDDEGALKRHKGTIEKLTGIRKPMKRGGDMYQVRFSAKVEGEGPLGYISDEKLEQGGWAKHVKKVADKILAEQGRYKRPLTQANVEALLRDVGLDVEYASHYQMNALSGGQKVKVVLAAAMWDQPHIVILDEPTNYLDRESLAALAVAIENFKGGVVIITHNDQFSKQLCPETWVLEKGDDGIGRLDCKGDAEWMQRIMSEKTEAVMMEEMVDGHGNTHKVKQPKRQLTRKERKQRELAKKQAREMGEHWSSSEED